LIVGVEFEKDYAQKPKKRVRNVGLKNSPSLYPDYPTLQHTWVYTQEPRATVVKA